MKKRTVVLAALCVVFLVICIVQKVAGNKNPVHTIAFDGNPDKISVFGNGVNVSIAKTGEDWFTTNGNYKVLPNTAELMVKYLKEIKVLDEVGSAGNEIVAEKYELNEGKAVTAIAYQGDKVLRSIKIGKSSSTGTQSYITIDGENKIYLVSGNYHTTLAKEEKDLVSKKIFSADIDSITGVTVNDGKTEYGFVHEDGAAGWTGTGAAQGVTFTDEKVDKWITSISYIDADNFIPDDTVLPEKAAAVVTVNTVSDSYVTSVYKFKSGDNEYVAVNNKNPHKFGISKFTAEKYIKSMDDLK